MTDIEKATLERRIDELCAEVERLHADQAHWELGNCPSCSNVVSLQEALEQNAKLRELANDYETLTATLCNERECDGCPFNNPEQIVCEHMRLQTCLAELGIEGGA